MQKYPLIQHVPTNIITGFLGVGKTTAILHLLGQKPKGERWAILVNEFGEIGVDGSLISGQFSESRGIFIKEVPGGCMCCAAGLPMQIALNQLLHRARPDRLIIEPTGLGHPVEVLQTLSAPHYQNILSIHQIITLVDARKIKDPRYAENMTFQQQISIADKIIGNKQDLYNDGDQALLEHFIAEQGNEYASLSFTWQGQLPLEALQGSTQTRAQSVHHHQKEPEPRINDSPLPESGYLSAENSGEGYESIGWRFSPTRVFSRTKLYAFLTGLDVERMKAVFITDAGVFGYNLTSDILTELELDDCIESRIEIICHQLDAAWETKLLNCALTD